MRSELESLQASGTFIWGKFPGVDRSTVLPVIWVFRVKRDGTLKARLTVRGDLDQQERAPKSKKEYYAPVAVLVSRRALLCLAALLGLILVLFDVKSAFTQAPLLDRRVFVHLPPGMKRTGHIGLLKKSLYGLRSAPQRWNSMIDALLKKCGFKSLTSDPCFYYVIEEANTTLICLHVDDGLSATSNMQFLDGVLKQLQEHMSIMVDREAKEILGGTLKTDDSGAISISHRPTLEAVTAIAGFEKATGAASTPVDLDIKAMLAEMIKHQQEDQEVLATQRFVGTLAYVARESRPDLSFISNLLARYATRANSAIQPVLKKCARYVSRTINYSLTYTASNTKSNFQVRALVDSDLGGDLDTLKSTSGWLVYIESNLVAWASKLQRHVTTSTAEAEISALCAAAKETIILRNILKELKLLKPGPSVISCDNQPVVGICKAKTHFGKTRHIALKTAALMEWIEKGELVIKHISSSANTADILTKPLKKATFQKHVQTIL
jgi:hypothetical protein